MLKLHIGCGKNFKQDYLNFDIVDPKIPGKDFIDFYVLDMIEKGLFNINSTVLGTIANWYEIKETTVDEVLSEHMMEHLSFIEEKETWEYIHEILKPGGKFIFEVPDFEWIINKWQVAYDNFKQFYALGKDHDYFGHGYSTSQRWGYLTAAIFGNQSAPGQFHKTAYTRGKIIDIAYMLGFNVISIENNMNKNHQNLRATLEKI